MTGLKILSLISFALLGLLVGIALRCAQEAKAYGMGFWELLEDKIMRMLGWW